MPFTLRYYQEDAVDSVFSYFISHKGNPIIAMPTGTGKSLVIAELLRRILHWYPDQRVHAITHVKTLIEQNSQKLLEQWPSAPLGVHSAGLKRRDVDHPIIFGGIQSMHRYAEAFGHIDLMIVDECHLIPSNSETMYGRYIAALLEINPLLKVIGLSATPYRLKGGHLTDGVTFDHVCYDNTRLEQFNKLIDEGYLAPVIPKQPKIQIDDTGLHTRAGEFIPAEVAERVDNDVTRHALLETIEEGRNRNAWMVFAVSIEHVEFIVEFLNHMGVGAVAYHSKMPEKEAEMALADFASGKFRAIVSRDRLTTGVDLPKVDLIAMLRLTRSPGLWVQMLGRGTRPHPSKKDCLVLDFAGNTRRLGPINDPILPDSKHRKGNGGGGQAPVKVCPECLTYQPASIRICGYCGAEFPRIMRLSAVASTQELIKRADEPPRTLKVDHMTYRRHKKEGKPDSLCVSYFCGLTRVQEYVLPDHGGAAATRARSWWQQRTSLDYPGTLDKIMQFLSYLPTPVRLVVDFNGKYPEVRKTEFIF